MKININVNFNGSIEVEVPETIKDKNLIKSLAEKKALCFILASLQNPDAPELEAFEDYKEDGGTESEWDETKLLGVNGVWNVI